MNSSEYSTISNLPISQSDFHGKIIYKPKFIIKPAIHQYARPLQNVQKSQQLFRVNLDKSNRRRDKEVIGHYGDIGIGGGGRGPLNFRQTSALPARTVLKPCINKNEPSVDANHGQQMQRLLPPHRPISQLVIRQYPPSLLLAPPKPKPAETLIYCKVCGRVYRIFEALRHHLLFYHQVNATELDKWYERYPLSNLNKAEPDPSLQPRRGRPPKYSLHHPINGQFIQAPSTYMSREEKTQRNKLLYERVICSLCQKDLFEDCMREHLKRVHGIISCSSKIGNYIGRRIGPMLKEAKNEGVGEIEGNEDEEEMEEQDGNEESTSSKMTGNKDECSLIRLVVCAVCKKALRRDSLREHLRTRHCIETAGLREAQIHIYDELDWQKTLENKHQRYASLKPIKLMYADSLKDDNGRIYCMLCDEAVYPGNLRSHLNVLHGISIASMMTKDAVLRYSIKVGNEEMEELVGAGEQMIIKNEIIDEQNASMPSTSQSNLNSKSANSIEVKEEMHSDEGE